MTDHKFTDDDVIKALECCKMPVGSCSCNNCPLDYQRKKRLTRSDKSCTTLMFDYTLTLINRQKAEIEEKSKNITFAAKELIRLDRERSEVIKEFAENVKAIFECVLYFDDDVKECILNEIDELVKEMTEGNHESQST